MFKTTYLVMGASVYTLLFLCAQVVCLKVGGRSVQQYSKHDVGHTRCVCPRAVLLSTTSAGPEMMDVVGCYKAAHDNWLLLIRARSPSSYLPHRGTFVTSEADQQI